MALVSANANAYDRALQIERDTTTYTLRLDGSYLEAHETATRILKETALDYAKDASVTYSTSVQRAEVVSAYTLKPDGRRIDAPASNYQVNAQAGRQGDSPVYSDNTTLTVVFPELEVGDTAVFAYRLDTLKPMFDNQFSVLRSFSPTTYYGDVRVIVDSPQAMTASSRNWQMRESKRSANGRNIVEWRWKNPEPLDPELIRDSTYNVERYPGYAFSTFTDYAQISSAYGKRANVKAMPTPRIETLALQVAAGSKDSRRTAKLLYDWVSKNITYAGNCIGLGAVVPRDLDVVLDNKMGDCKDHATLLQALLRARGIDSTQALVNAGEVYELPAIPVASMVNHVINYIPALDLYLDSTAATVPFGSLPQGVAGKRVLLVDGYRDDTKTPAVEAGKDWQRMKTTLRIAADGSVKGEFQLELGGRLALGAREQFRSFGEDDAARLVKRYFKSSGLEADGKIRYDDPKPMLETFSMSADFDVAKMLPVPGGMAVQPWFLNYAPVSSIVAALARGDEKDAGESNCGGVLTDEEYVFDFPESIHIAAVPHDLSVHGENVDYVASYRRDGRRVLVKRTLNDRTPGPVCSAQYNRTYTQTMKKIVPDVRAQIVYLLDAAPR